MVQRQPDSEELARACCCDDGRRYRTPCVNTLMVSQWRIHAGAGIKNPKSPSNAFLLKLSAAKPPEAHDGGVERATTTEGVNSATTTRAMAEMVVAI